MTDKVTIQPKSKPEKTTISISGETSERLEIYCRANGILRKEFVSLALEYFERTGFDLKSNALVKSEEQAKELQVLQEENDRLRNEIKVLQEYKEKAHRELCRVRDEQKTFGKIKVKTEFNL
jgi:hypothetical protein